MAFDAGMVCAVVHEIRMLAENSRVEKIQQPQKDEIVITLYSAAKGANLRLAINAGANNPKIGFTTLQKENPAAAPMLCMLLRKQLGGGKLVCARQIGFDRIAELEFACRDEMGFAVTRLLIVEIMGKYSNLILTDADKRIIAAMKYIDFSTSRARQILPGMTYELPPAQDKRSLFDMTEENLTESLTGSDTSMPLSKWILGNYGGISPLVSRELAHRACGTTDCTIARVRPSRLYEVLHEFVLLLDQKNFCPTIVYDELGKPLEFCFMDLLQYGSSVAVEHFECFSDLLDAYFEKRDLAERINHRGHDIIRLLSNARARLQKKLELQREELAQCQDGERCKLCGDLITANIYMLHRGMTQATLTNFYSDDSEETNIELDSKLTPQQNAQHYYKRYNKCKNAKIYITEQIDKAESELAYLETVSDALSRAETESDLAEIRAELAGGGYASRIKKGAKPYKNHPASPMEFKTSGGYRAVCGKNNVQNDYITFKLASKSDLWFHVKGRAGAHVVLLCGDTEPSERDYTEAAMIAATYSSVGEQGQIPVDYTRVKNIKKPPSAKPGYVTYSTNYTAYVERDETFCEQLRCK